MRRDPATVPVLSWLCRTQERLGPRDADRAARLLVLDGATVSGMATLQGGLFLSACVLAMGGNHYQVGLLTSIGFLAQAMQLLGLWGLPRFPYRRATTVLACLAARLMWIPVAAIALLAPQGAVTWLLLCLLASACLGAVTGPWFNSLLQDVLPPARLGRIMSRRMGLGVGLAVLLTLGGGWFIDHWKEVRPDAVLHGYAAIFLVGLVLGLLSLGALALLPEPAFRPSATEPLPRQLLRPFRDANYRRLMVFFTVWSLAMNMVAPFFIIYMLERLRLSLMAVTAVSVTGQVVIMVFLRVWGRIADRFSNRAVLLVNCPLFLLTVAGWIFTAMPGPDLLMPYLVLLQFSGGVSFAGVMLGTTNIALKLAPAGSAHVYMTVYGLMGAAAGAVAPIIGGALADLAAGADLSIGLRAAWAGAAGARDLWVFNLRGLDYTLLAAALVGLYSLYHLGRVHETGDVDEADVLRDFMREVAGPFRSLGTASEIRRLAFMPINSLLDRRRNPPGPPDGGGGRAG